MVHQKMPLNNNLLFRNNLVLKTLSVGKTSPSLWTFHQRYRADARINCQPSRKRQTNDGSPGIPATLCRHYSPLVRTPIILRTAGVATAMQPHRLVNMSPRLALA